MGKLDRTKKWDRIEKVSEMIGDGYFTYQIVNYAMSEWKVCRRTAERYIEQVTKFLKRELTQDDKEKILLEYDKLIHKYEKRGDAKIAIQYRQMRDKILGLYVTKTDVTTNGKDIQPTIINIIKPNE